MFELLQLQCMNESVGVKKCKNGFWCLGLCCFRDILGDFSRYWSVRKLKKLKVFKLINFYTDTQDLVVEDRKPMKNIYWLIAQCLFCKKNFQIIKKMSKKINFM